MTSRPAVVAHRGNSSLAPQNTLAAFEAAWRAGADSIEIDIQVTSDGDAAVIHDATLDATTDATGPVAERTAVELGTLDAGAWFAPAFAGQRIPLLADVLAFLHDRDGIELLLEVKDAWAREPLARALAAVEASGVADRVVVQSFSVDTMRLAAELAPGLRRELLIASADGDLIGLCRELGVSGCNPDGRLLLANPSLLRTLKDAGLRVTTWTLDEPEHWAAALAVGVDGIITDRPDRLLGWLAAQRS